VAVAEERGSSRVRVMGLEIMDQEVTEEKKGGSLTVHRRFMRTEP